MSGQVGFFELGVADADQGRAFYEGLFGWEFAPTVDALDAALTRVTELGGEVMDADVEGDESSQQQFGRFKLCVDDQGSPFGLHEPPAS